jgi:hypothetical protein
VFGADALDDVQLVVLFGLHEAGFAHGAFAQHSDFCVVLLLGCDWAFHIYKLEIKYTGFIGCHMFDIMLVDLRWLIMRYPIGVMWLRTIESVMGWSKELIRLIAPYSVIKFQARFKQSVTKR